MRAGQGRGLESIILTARQRAASLLESVASGRITFEQALALWPDGRGDDPDVEAARRSLRRRAQAPALVATARALRAGRQLDDRAGSRPARGSAAGSSAPGPSLLGRRNLLAAFAAGLLLLVLAAWLLTAIR